MGNGVYVIAEIGINFNGDFETCLRLIDAAAAAGCDAAKFQLFRAKTLYPRTAGSLDWRDDQGSYSYDIYDAVRSNELPLEWVEPLMDHCRGKRLDFLASVFAEEELAYLVGKGVPALKVSSSSVNNIPLLRSCASSGLPIILSTGGATLGEVEEAVETVTASHDRLTLLHCSLQYPTPPERCNLGVISTLRTAFPEIRTGYSDHTAEPCEAPRQAVYLGARVIEKHVTLDRTMAGPDHFFALEPAQLAEMVAAIRRAEKEVAAGTVRIDPVYFGTSRKSPGDHERYLREFVRNQLFARRPIPAGQPITPRDIIILRRGKKGAGLEPRHLELFERYAPAARRPICAEEPITWEMIL